MFYRTQDGAEIDLLFERAGKIEMALEIKRSTAPKVERGFFLACDDLQIERRFVVYSGQEGYPISHGATVLSLTASKACPSHSALSSGERWLISTAFLAPVKKARRKASCRRSS